MTTDERKGVVLGMTVSFLINVLTVIVIGCVRVEQGYASEDPRPVLFVPAGLLAVMTIIAAWEMAGGE